MPCACSQQVDDCLAKWQWMRTMLARVQEAKRQGKPLPNSIEDMERTVGGESPTRLRQNNQMCCIAVILMQI